MRPEDELSQQRDSRIAQLEARLARQSPVGVKAPAAVALLLCSALLLFLQRKDLAYAVSPKVPLNLGAEGAYRLDALASNRYARVQGVPTLRGAYGREGDQVYVVVGVRETPLLVRRRALPGEEWLPGKKPPQPDQRPFTGYGRLLAQADAARYAEGFKVLAAHGEVRPRDGQLWILIEDERPGQDLGTLLAAGLEGALIALSAYFLRRDLQARFARGR